MIDRIGFLTAIPAMVAGWFGLRKPKERNEFAEARRVMGKTLNVETMPDNMRFGYVSNLAFLIYDDQNKTVHDQETFGFSPPLDLNTVEGCNAMAERILNLMFKEYPFGHG